MLLYEDTDERNAAETGCIKEALGRGQFCVYASIDMHDKDLLGDFISRIPGCDSHIEQGNLLITDLRPFYDAALAGSLDLFEQLREKIEGKLAARASAGRSAKTLIVADAACHLVRNRHFGEAARLETWWQQTFANWTDMGLDISIICSHPALILKENVHAKDMVDISHEHSRVLDLKDFGMPNRSDKKLLHILVVEPEEDMHEIYQWAFNELPIQAQIVKSGKQCYDLIASQNEKTFDVVIVDSHLPDAGGSSGSISNSSSAGGLGLVRRILDRFPDQAIIITTANDELVRSNLDAMPLQSLSSSDNISILPKPFELSKLLALLKPAAAK